MSWSAVGWAKKIVVAPTGKPITRSEKFLLLTIADYYNEKEGCAWASVKTLAFDILSSERQTRYLLRALEAKGLLRTEARVGAPNRYFLAVDKLMDKRPPVAKGGAMVAGAEGQPVPGRAALAPAGEGGNSLCPQTDIEPSKQQQGFFSTRRWSSEDRWLKQFLDSPEAFFIPLGALDDPVWWESVSIACGGLDPDFIRREFAKMRAYLTERNLRFALTGPEQCKDFVRRWLCREDQWERKRRA